MGGRLKKHGEDEKKGSNLFNIKNEDLPYNLVYFVFYD
jgi:hypothetical protein